MLLGTGLLGSSFVSRESALGYAQSANHSSPILLPLMSRARSSIPSLNSMISEIDPGRSYELSSL